MRPISGAWVGKSLGAGLLSAPRRRRIGLGRAWCPRPARGALVSAGRDAGGTWATHTRGIGGASRLSEKTTRRELVFRRKGRVWRALKVPLVREPIGKKSEQSGRSAKSRGLKTRKAAKRECSKRTGTPRAPRTDNHGAPRASESKQRSTFGAFGCPRLVALPPLARFAYKGTRTKGTARDKRGL